MIRLNLRLLALPAVLLAASAAFNATEIQCEEAIAQLQSCCPGLEAPNVCGGAGCAPDVTLTLDESACIQDMRCGPEAQVVCERVKALSDRVAHSMSGSSDSGVGAGAHGVCP